MIDCGIKTGCPRCVKKINCPNCKKRFNILLRRCPYCYAVNKELK
jgi:hypothetical protein